MTLRFRRLPQTPSTKNEMLLLSTRRASFGQIWKWKSNMDPSASVRRAPRQLWGTLGGAGPRSLRLRSIEQVFPGMIFPAASAPTRTFGAFFSGVSMQLPIRTYIPILDKTFCVLSIFRQTAKQPLINFIRLSCACQQLPRLQLLHINLRFQVLLPVYRFVKLLGKHSSSEVYTKYIIRQPLIRRPDQDAASTQSKRKTTTTTLSHPTTSNQNGHVYNDHGNSHLYRHVGNVHDNDQRHVDIH